MFSGLIRALSHMATAKSFSNYMMAIWLLLIAIAWVMFAMGTLYILAKVYGFEILILGSSLNFYIYGNVV